MKLCKNEGVYLFVNSHPLVIHSYLLKKKDAIEFQGAVMPRRLDQKRFPVASVSQCYM